MSYEINADKYAFAQAPEPEKTDENYNAVLVRKMFSEEAKQREALGATLEQSILNEVYARTDGDIELKGRIDSEVLTRNSEISALDTRLRAEIDARTLKEEELSECLAEEASQRAASDASLLQAVDNLEEDLTVESARWVASHNELSDKLEQEVRGLNQAKENKTVVLYAGDLDFTFSIIHMHNGEWRCVQPLTSLSLVFENGEYSNDYISGLSFDSGETPTSIDYTGNGILNWVGTDCTTADGLSIFQPSANTHYDIVFYVNGNQFIGLVNGFVPATGNVVSA